MDQRCPGGGACLRSEVPGGGMPWVRGVRGGRPWVSPWTISEMLNRAKFFIVWYKLSIRGDCLDVNFKYLLQTIHIKEGMSRLSNCHELDWPIAGVFSTMDTLKWWVTTYEYDASIAPPPNGK